MCWDKYFFYEVLVQQIVWLSLDSILEHFKTKGAPTDNKSKSVKGHYFLVRWKDGQEGRFNEVDGYPYSKRS